VPNEVLKSSLLVFPAAADSVTLASDGGANTYGTWVELVASAPSNLFIAGITLGDFHTNVENYYGDIQVGHGGAGSEVALATFGFLLVNLGIQAIDGNVGVILAGIPVSGISSGDRIAVRMRVGSGNNRTYKVSGLFLPNPITGTLETTSKALKCTDVVTATSGGSAWTSGSWVEVFSSTVAALVINHLVIGIVGFVTSSVEIDIGVGPAASEVVIYTYKAPTNALANVPCLFQLPILLDNIGNGVRVAVRSRCSIASQAIATRLGYYEKPL
jgi:hypothetical protein